MHAKGSFDGAARAYSIDANDQMLDAPTSTATSSSPTRNGAPVRLSDVAASSRAPRTASSRAG